MKHLIWILIVVMLILHHDFWFWNDDRLVFGVLPMGLFYHACLSLAAAMFWWIAVTFAWPVESEPGPVESEPGPVESEPGPVESEPGPVESKVDHLKADDPNRESD